MLIFILLCVIASRVFGDSSQDGEDGGGSGDGSSSIWVVVVVAMV